MSNEKNTTETAVTEIVDDGQPLALAALERTEIDMHIATAKKYPRTISRALDQARELINMDKETAESAVYTLPPFGNETEPVQGPSIRMAELLASQWGNLRYGSRPLEYGEKTVTAQGFAYDLQTNAYYTCVKTRSILNKYGVRYPQHAIVKTMLAAQAIAERDAILKIVPKAFATMLMKEALDVATGKDLSMDERRTKAVETLAKYGVPETDLLRFLGHEGRQDITLKDIHYLRGIVTALKDGQATVADYFYREDVRKEPEKGTLAPEDISAPEEQPQTSTRASAQDAPRPPAKRRKKAEAKPAPEPQPEPAPAPVQPEAPPGDEATLREQLLYELTNRAIPRAEWNALCTETGVSDQYAEIPADKLAVIIAEVQKRFRSLAPPADAL